jgi:hypothetical protein
MAIHAMAALRYSARAMAALSGIQTSPTGQPSLVSWFAASGNSGGGVFRHWSELRTTT